MATILSFTPPQRSAIQEHYNQLSESFTINVTYATRTNFREWTTRSIEALDEKVQRKVVDDGFVVHHLLRSASGFDRYLPAVRYHLLTGGKDLIISDGVAFQEDQPFPSPMVVFLMGLKSDADNPVARNFGITLSARGHTFDGEIQDFDTAAVSNHEKAWISSILPMPHSPVVRGYVNVELVNALHDTFRKDALACCLGYEIEYVENICYLTYLEIVGPQHVIEWRLGINMDAYYLIQSDEYAR